jgi:hypothetical protein
MEAGPRQSPGLTSAPIIPSASLPAMAFSTAPPPDLQPISSPPKPRQLQPAGEDDAKPRPKTADDLLPVSQLTIVRKLRYSEQFDSC